MTDQAESTAKTVKRLEYAATLLLEMLPTQIHDLAIEIADLQYQCPRWHVVAGAVLRLSEEGRLADYSTEPHWDSDKIDREPTLCPQCDTLFDPERLGQVYCCNPCGDRASKGLKGGQDDDVRLTNNSSAPVDLPSDQLDTINAPPSGDSSLAEALRESADIALREITQ